MRFNLQYLLGSVFIAVCFVLLTSSVLGQTDTPTPTPEEDQEEQNEDDEDSDQQEAIDENLEEIQGKISEYESKIDELQSQQKSLNSQIEIVDSQIALAELRIDEAEQKISNLEEDIDVTEDKISNLEVDIEGRSKALLNRVIASYKYGKIQPWEVFFTSESIDKFFTRLKYLKIVQHYDQKKVIEAEQSKVNYANQQNILQEKQEEAEQLYAQLDEYNAQLEEERQAKEDLLAVTENSEAEYQARLSDALRELRQIQQASEVLVDTEPRRVSKGEAIGLMGNTGYSFGAHLHFGVYNISELSEYDYYSNHTDPSGVLSSVDVSWDTGCSSDPSGVSNTGGGSFDWPMSTSSLEITQGYGHTCYSDVYYRGNPHPAYDMVSRGSIVVRAVESGNAYFCRNCTGDGANGVFLFHDNGKMTLYWHLQ